MTFPQDDLAAYLFFFFFKQKTAYEIGLGIPAEPLFRSMIGVSNLQSVNFCVMEAIKLCRLDTPIIFIEARINLSRFVVTGCAAKTRSEERRVGKECRYRRAKDQSTIQGHAEPHTGPVRQR